MYTYKEKSENSEEPTLKDANFPSYLVKDKTTKPYFIERSLVRMENVPGHDKPFVRAYQVIYAPARNSKRKDVTLTEDNLLQINGTENVWINMGNPHRAVDFFRKYRQEGLERAEELQNNLINGKEAKFDGHQFKTVDEIKYYNGRPVIRSFLIPVDIYKQITENAISEHQSTTLGKYTKNSDQTRAPDQYGVNKQDLNLIRKHALPFSLTSHVIDDYLEEYQCNKANGCVKGISDLLHELGMPETYLSDPEISYENCLTKADELHQLYKKSLEINDLEKEKASFEPLLKNAKIKTPYPSALGELNFFQEQLGKQASFAMIPHIIRDNYNEAVKKTNAEYYIGCGLIKVDDQIELKLANVPNIALNRNSILLYKDKLYHAGSSGKKISPIDQNPDNSVRYNSLKERINNDYRLANSEELNTIISLVKCPAEVFQREVEFSHVNPSKWTEEQEFISTSPEKFNMK